MKTFETLLIVLLISGAASAQMSLRQHCFPLDGTEETELLRDNDVLDAYSLGHIVFVYRKRSLPTPEAAVTDLTKIISVDRAVEHGKPDKVLLNQLQSPLFGMELTPSLDEATAVSRGDQGFFWRISWELFPAKGALGGVPWTCRTYVGPDGAPILVERALCDIVRFPKAANNEEEENGYLISSIPFAELPKRTKDQAVIHGEEILSRAQAELKAAFEQSGRQPKDPIPSLRFRDQSLIKVPYEMLHTGDIVYRDVWAVRFVPADLKPDAILTAEPFTVWVTVDGQVSKLTWNGWKMKP